jgi:large subunit ribosomal protein L20
MPLFSDAKYARLAKGFQGRAKNCSRTQYNKVQKALQYSYRERHRRPRLMRTDRHFI